MNNQLKDRIFDIPQNILDSINHAVSGLNGQHFHGLNRAKKLLQDKKVKYGQLKRIIHDLQKIDKINDKVKFNLCGGDMMEKWSKQFLDGERDMISNNKDAKMNADKISSMTGERRNSHLKSHTKKNSYKTPTNLIKSNSDSSSVSSLKPGLFEELEKIKKLILY